MKINNRRLDELLIRKKWNSSDLAESMGINRSALTQQRYHTARVQTKTIGQIAEALGVDYKEFVDLDPEVNHGA